MAFLTHGLRVLAYKCLGGLFNLSLPGTGTYVPGWPVYSIIPGYWHISAWVAFLTHGLRVLAYKCLGGLFNLSFPGIGT